MVRSGLISREIAHYMIAPSLFRCDDNASFWSGLDRQDPAWALFRAFAREMRDMEDHQKLDRAMDDGTVDRTFRYVDRLRF